MSRLRAAVVEALDQFFPNPEAQMPLVLDAVVAAVDAHLTDRRPMESAPRDGTVIKLWMGRDQAATVGWFQPGHMPWSFLDRQTSPAGHFLNRAVFHLPVAWAPLDNSHQTACNEKVACNN